MAINTSLTRYNFTLKADYNADTLAEVEAVLLSDPVLYKDKYFQINDQGNAIFKAVMYKPNTPLVLEPAYDSDNWLPVLPDQQEQAQELTINSDTTLTDSTYQYISVDTTNEEVTLTLPPAGLMTGDFIYVKKISDNITNDVVIVGDSGEEVEFGPELRIKFYRTSVSLYSNGLNWKA